MFTVEIDSLQHAVGGLCITVFAGVNSTGFSLVPLELERHFILALLDSVILHELIHASCIFDTARGSHIVFSLGSHGTCKIPLLLVWAVC